MSDLMYYGGVAILTTFVAFSLYAFCYVIGILTYSKDEEEAE